MADEKKRITAYPTASSLGDDDYVMIDNGGANGTKKFKAKNLGGGWNETSLWTDSEGVYTGSIQLSDDISNYNLLIFQVNDLQRYPSYLIVPTLALVSQSAEQFSMGTYSQAGSIWFQIELSGSDALAIHNNSGQNHKIYEVIGVN